MIAYIDGTLTHKEPAIAIVEAAGVGYEVRISLQTYSLLPAVGQGCKLFTFLSIREDAHVLFGFSSFAEKQLFLNLTGISGIGPATALLMLSSHSADEISDAIASGNVALVQSIKGIGLKTAQRIVLELREKMQRQGSASLAFAPGSAGLLATKEEALAALMALGMPKITAERSIAGILKNEPGQITVEELIKRSLR